MNLVLGIVGAGEAITLLYVLIVLAGLQNRMKRLNDRSTATVNQMRDLVQEAQTLSTVLATQLAEQARLVEAQAEDLPHRQPGEGTPQRERGKEARPAAPGAARAAAIVRPAAPSEEAALLAARDKELAEAAVAARERGMDPLGVALQRSLRRRPASA